MAKGIEMNGQLRGKRGGVVYSTRGGEQISRAYTPHNSNPSTQRQVNQRSRFKLASQLASSMAQVIAIRKKGLQSARNQFVNKNMGAIIANQGQSQITLENVQLTDGISALPQVVITRGTNYFTVALAAAPGPEVTRVVYNLFLKNEQESLQLIDSFIVDEAGQDGKFSNAESPSVGGEILVLAYGIKDLSASATANFGNMACETGVDIATLASNRQLSSSDYSFTETRGATLAADQSAVEPTPAGSYRIFATASGNGTVSGAGTYAQGASCTLVATPNTGSTFLGWKEQNGGVGNIDTGNYVSTSASYTFTVTGQRDLVAFFNTPGGGNGGSTDPDDGDEG